MLVLHDDPHLHSLDVPALQPAQAQPLPVRGRQHQQHRGLSEQKQSKKGKGRGRVFPIAPPVPLSGNHADLVHLRHGLGPAPTARQHLRQLYHILVCRELQRDFPKHFLPWKILESQVSVFPAESDPDPRNLPV